MNPAWRRRSMRLAVLAALFGLTGWSILRSEALDQADAAYVGARNATGLANALRLALDHLDRRPWSRPAARIAALCYSRLDFPDAAEPYYQKAQADSSEDLHVRAYAILRANRREQAIAAYNAILAHWPEDVRALRLLGGLYLSRSQWPHALAIGERLARLSGGEVLGHHLAGMANHYLDDLEPAVAEFRRVLAIDPQLSNLPEETRPALWNALARDLIELGRFEDAREVLDAALAQADSATLRTFLAQAHRRGGHRAEAERELDRAIELDPRLAAAWLERGRIALDDRRPADALAPLERANALAPTAPEPLFSLAAAYRQLGKREQAAVLQTRSNALRARAKLPARGMGARSEARP